MKFYLLLLAILLAAPSAQGHVPLLPEGNDNISLAEYISDPDKSWAIYSQLNPDEAEYYSFFREKGDRIYLSLLSSANPGKESFEPDMALLGPGLTSDAGTGAWVETETALPGYVSLPEGYGYIAVFGQRTENATYEPFGPSSYYEQSLINITAPRSGMYYAVVYDNDSNGTDSSIQDSGINGNNIQGSSIQGSSTQGSSVQGSNNLGRSGDNQSAGHYSLALGYLEEFSFTDRLLMPLRLVSVYLWEGQSLRVIITPWIVAALAGIFIVLRSPRRTPFFSAGTMAGFLYLGTSASVLTQTIFSLTRAPYGPEVGISMALVLIPAILGIAALRLARGEAGILQRSVMAVIGTIGLLAGSGFIIGPLLAIAASVLPSKKALNKADSAQK